MNNTNAKSPFISDLRDLEPRVHITFWLLTLIMVLLLSQQNLDSPNLTQIGKSFGLDPGNIRLFIGGKAYLGTTIVSSIALIIFGYLTDKVNRKTLLVISAAISGAAYLAAPFAVTVDQYIIMRSAAGVGIGGIVPVMFSITGDIFTERSRAAASGVIMVIINLGIGFGFVLGSVAGPEHMLGWRGSFFLQSILLLCLVALFLAYGRFPLRGHAEKSLHDRLAEGKREYKERIKLSDVKNILTNRTNLVFIFASFFATFSGGFVQRFMVDAYATHGGISEMAAALFLMLVLSGTIIGDMLGGFFGDFLRKKNRVYPIYFALTVPIAGTFLLFIFFSLPLSAGFAFPQVLLPVLIGFTGAALIEVHIPIQKAMMLNVNVPENRGTISAIIQTSAQMGFGAGAYLISLMGVRVADLLNREHTPFFDFQFAALLWLIPILSWAFIIFTGRRDEDRAAALIGERAKKLDIDSNNYS